MTEQTSSDKLVGFVHSVNRPQDQQSGGIVGLVWPEGEMSKNVPDRTSFPFVTAGIVPIHHEGKEAPEIPKFRYMDKVRFSIVDLTIGGKSQAATEIEFVSHAPPPPQKIPLPQLPPNVQRYPAKNIHLSVMRASLPTLMAGVSDVIYSQEMYQRAEKRGDAELPGMKSTEQETRIWRELLASLSTAYDRTEYEDDARKKYEAACKAASDISKSHYSGYIAAGDERSEKPRSPSKADYKRQRRESAERKSSGATEA